jgi:hypothetical protein
MFVTKEKPNFNQLITLAEIETDLMLLNAQVKFCIDNDSIEDDLVDALITQYEVLGEKYTVFCAENNINFHPINSSIVQLHQATSFDHFWRNGVDNGLFTISSQGCSQCQSGGICGIHG